MPSKKYLLVPALAAALLGAGTFGTVTSAHAHGYCDGPGGGYGHHRGYQQGYNAPDTYQDERGNYRAGEPTNLTPKQRKAYTRLMDKFNAKAEPLRDQMFVKRSQLRALENSPRASRAEVERLSREYRDLDNKLRDLEEQLERDMKKEGIR